MAGIPWGKYDATDWVRIPGPQRRYRNIRNPSIEISRRQFDEHYGAASKFGTYEKKARAKAQEPEALLRPARGRTSGRKLTPAQKEVELGRRKVSREEAKQQKLIDKLSSKQTRSPKTITLRNFRKGTQIRRFRIGVDPQEIEALRQAGAKSRIVFGYWVGLEMVSERDGQIKTLSLFSQRDINMPFTERDFRKALEKAAEKNYATLTGMWIAMHLTMAAAKKNGARVK